MRLLRDACDAAERPDDVLRECHGHELAAVWGGVRLRNPREKRALRLPPGADISHAREDVALVTALRVTLVAFVGCRVTIRVSVIGTRTPRFSYSRSAAPRRRSSERLTELVEERPQRAAPARRGAGSAQRVEVLRQPSGRRGGRRLAASAT